MYNVIVGGLINRGEYSTFSPIPTILQVQEVLSMEKKICTVDGCDNQVESRGYCTKHYAKWKKYKNPLYVHPRYIHSDICIVEGCNGKHSSLGYCNKHYLRFKKHGNPHYLGYRKTHGMADTPEYNIWGLIKDRCFNKNSHAYYRYGGRGITVCDRWKNSFVNFLDDMGKRPFPEAEIDREENDGNYDPGNCRWTTAKVNSRNRRNNKLNIQKARDIRKKYKAGNITYQKIADQYGVDKSLIYLIVRNKSWIE